MKNVFIVLILLILFLPFLAGCTPHKYEGLTAREWADEYYWLSSCIEDSENPKEECL